MKKKSILIVEDDNFIQESLKELLEEEGEYIVRSVYDGDEALAFLKDTNNINLPDLILLDIMMPNKNGEEFSIDKANDPILSSIPVIIISAAGNLTPEQKSLGNAYLKKPFDADELIQEIKKQLEGRTKKNGVVNSSGTSSKESQL